MTEDFSQPHENSLLLIEFNEDKVQFYKTLLYINAL